MTNDEILRYASEPLHGLLFQGLIVAKGHTRRAAASTADTFIRVHIYGSLLVYDGPDSTDRFGKTRLAVVFTDDV